MPFQIYRALLTIRPTSVESERAFSSLGLFATRLRTRLSDESLDALVFMRQFYTHKDWSHKWLKLKRTFINRTRYLFYCQITQKTFFKTNSVFWEHLPCVNLFFAAFYPTTRLYILEIGYETNVGQSTEVQLMDK